MQEDQAREQVMAHGRKQILVGDNMDDLCCPRCGHLRMAPTLLHNALSRRADVYICDICGMDEAIRDGSGAQPLPFSEWAICKENNASDVYVVRPANPEES